MIKILILINFNKKKIKIFKDLQYNKKYLFQNSFILLNETALINYC